MRNKKLDNFCPACGKATISRNLPPLDAGILDAGGWNDVCPICKAILYIPTDEFKPIELVVIPAICLPDFKLEEDLLEEEKRVLVAASKGEMEI